MAAWTATPAFLWCMFPMMALITALMCPSALKLSLYYFSYNNRVVFCTIAVVAFNSLNMCLMNIPSMCFSTSYYDIIRSLRDDRRNIIDSLSWISLLLLALSMLSNILAMICSRNVLLMCLWVLSNSCLLIDIPAAGLLGSPASSPLVTNEPILLVS